MSDIFEVELVGFGYWLDVVILLIVFVFLSLSDFEVGVGRLLKIKGVG